MPPAPWAYLPASEPGIRTGKRHLKGHILIDGERCKGCSLCIDFCPKTSISLSDELNLKGYFVAAFAPGSACNGCGSCALMCPEAAIEVTRT